MLDTQDAQRLLGDAEDLLAEAERVLREEPTEISEEDTAQLEHDVNIVREALRSPRPDSVTVERALGRVAAVLSLVKPEVADLQSEFEAAGFTQSEAGELAFAVDQVGSLVQQLGREDPAEDVALATAMGDTLRSIKERISRFAARVPKQVDDAARVKEANIRGREKVLGRALASSKGDRDRQLGEQSRTRPGRSRQFGSRRGQAWHQRIAPACRQGTPRHRLRLQVAVDDATANDDGNVFAFVAAKSGQRPAPLATRLGRLRRLL